MRLILMGALVVLLGMNVGRATEVTPDLVDRWQSGDAAFECAQAGGCGEFAYKVDNWDATNGMDGDYEHEGNTITISASDGKTFTWASKYPVCAVIVKAGTGAYIYRYDGALGDVGLTAPEGKDISHVTFCFKTPTDYEELTVTKTANTSFTREHFWDIAKKVETALLNDHEGFPQIWLYIDGSGDEKATWTVDVTYDAFEDSDWNVSGEIVIENTGTLDATITGIEDILVDWELQLIDYPIEVDCGDDMGIISPDNPYVLPVGETLTCTYSVDVDLGLYTPVFNMVTVTTASDKEYDAGAEIIWEEAAINEINATVTIKDSSDLFGDVVLGEVTAPNGQQFTYSKDFAWADYGADNCGNFVYENIATIVETVQSASATLKVAVQCFVYETAFAKGDSAERFIPTFSRWGWTNPIAPNSYTWPLWAGAAQCDTTKGTLVGSVTVSYIGGHVTVIYNVDTPYSLEETHVYAGTGRFPLDKRGSPTVAPGAYYNASPFNGGPVYVIAHAAVGLPDPDFGPNN